MLANGGVTQHQDDDRKIIVRQLDFNTVKSTVEQYFGEFGSVEQVIMKTNEEGKSKGFSFVIFAEASCIQTVLAVSPHTIDNKQVIVEKAIPMSDRNRTTRLFVGGLPHGLDEDALKQYFTNFGEIESFEFIFDKITSQRKHFCFMVFKDHESVEKVTEGKMPPKSVQHFIGKYRVDCQKKFEDNHPVQKKIKEQKWAERGGGHQTGYGGQDQYKQAYDANAWAGYAGYDPSYAAYGYGAYAGYGQGYGYEGYGTYDQSGYAAAAAEVPAAPGTEQYSSTPAGGPIRRGGGRGEYKPY